MSYAWAVLLLLSSIFFLWKLIRTRKVDLSLAFALSLLFNFILHLGYGYEPFLYSPDWAYALVFFVALSLVPLAGNRFFQAALLLFLILLAYNQVQFLQFILDTIKPFALGWVMSKFFNFRIFIAWILSIPAVFLAVGFLDDFYSTILEFILSDAFGCNSAALFDLLSAWKSKASACLPTC